MCVVFGVGSPVEERVLLDPPLFLAFQWKENVEFLRGVLGEEMDV